MSLKNIGHQLESQIQEGITWMDRCGKMDREKQARFQDSQRRVRKVLRVLEKKPVFALFGASQVGKSYLAHIILSGADPVLKIDLGGDDPVNFLTQINPPGGRKEATGVVTRFTITKIQHKAHPVLVRFMSMEDICTVLCKAYYENLQGRIPTAREVTIEAIEALRNDLKSVTASPSLPSSEEIRYSLRDLEQNLKQNFVAQHTHWEDVEAAGVWEICHSELDRLLTRPDLFARLLGVLWEGHAGLSAIAAELLQGLKSLNWGEEGHLPANSVLRKAFGGAAIVDVESLEALGTVDADADVVEVLLNGQDTTSLKTSVLSALTKEVVLTAQLPEGEVPGYLQLNDIMDFPGARSPDNLSQNTDQIYRPYLRGKVAHLFNQYSRDFEVNNLIFCIPDAQNDGQNKLPEVLNNWILSNVGENAIARQQLIADRGSSPLMVVFTWFNKQIDFDKTNDRVNTLFEKWNKRFKTFFEDQMISDNTWAEQWTTEGGFKNIFPLRDYEFSKQTFSGYTVDSPEETGYEPIDSTDEFQSAEEFQAALKESFIASEWCQKYLEVPEDTWDACALPNLDGSAPIIHAMERASKSAAIEVHAKSVLRDAKTKALDELNRHYHDDDVAAQHAQAERLSAELNLALKSLAASQPGAVVALQSALALNAEDVTEWLGSQVVTSTQTDKEALERFLLNHAFLIETLSPAECVEAYRLHYRLADRESAIESGWNDWGVDLKNLFPAEKDESASSPLIEQALEYFQGRCLVFDEERHGHLTVGALTGDLLRATLEELIQGMKTRKIAQRISEFVAGQPEISVMGQIDAPRLGALIAHQWNEFMFFADASYYTEAELEKVRFTVSDRAQNAVEAYEALTSAFGSQPLARLSQVHQQPGIDLIAGWLQRLSNLFIVNCGFANYDPAENEALASILNELKTIDI